MSDYNPDKFVIIEVIVGNGVPFYKVFGTWAGGYLDGDSWRLNSGVVKIEEDDKNYKLYGNSGSCYTCPKGSYGVAGHDNNTVLKQLQDVGEKAKVTVFNNENKALNKLKEYLSE